MSCLFTVLLQFLPGTRRAAEVLMPVAMVTIAFRTRRDAVANLLIPVVMVTTTSLAAVHVTAVNLSMLVVVPLCS